MISLLNVCYSCTFVCAEFRCFAHVQIKYPCASFRPIRMYSFSAEGALRLLYGSLYVPLQLELMSHRYFVELCVFQQDTKEKEKTHVALRMRAS